MKFHVAWHSAALYVFYRLPIHSATLVDRAVQRFAETGEGQLSWWPPYYRLRAGLFWLAITIDIEHRTVNVIHIFRAPPHL